jgi:hypothetical protein
VEWNQLTVIVSRRARASSGASRCRVNRNGCAATRAVSTLIGALVFALAFSTGAARAADEDGFHATPSVYWKSGDHRLDLGADFRLRPEWWNARGTTTDLIWGLRTRVRAKYDFRKLVTLFGEFQDARVYHMSPSATGIAAAYRRFSRTGNDDMTDGQDIRQGWIEVRPMENLAIRAGRTDIKLGVQTLAQEANWKYLQIKRASQRLVGTVGWTDAERSNDGGSLSYSPDGYNLYVFGANPTTGVFDIHKAYEHQSNLVHGGIQLTAKRGTWLPNTEMRTFFLGYGDGRPAREAGRFDGQNIITTGAMDIQIYSFGFSTVGVYPVGDALFDVFVWGAGQGGKFNGRDHLAAAGILELGYMLPDVIGKPWFRLGFNAASGGGKTGDHNTFHNLMPTNHLYYGFADQFAFQNLMDVFGQIKFKLHDKVGVNLILHHFSLLDPNDNWYFGTGAFTRQGNKPGAFGYGGRSTGGNANMGTEFDFVIDWKVNRHLGLSAGYSYLWGSDGFKFINPANPDTQFGFMQLHLKY